MAKIVNMYTIEIEQDDLGKKIDLRELAKTKLETNTVKEIIEKEIEIKLAQDKIALEDRIRKQEQDRYQEELKLAQKATKSEIEKLMQEEINKAKLETEKEKSQTKSAIEKLEIQEQNFKKLLDAEKAKEKSEAEKQIQIAVSNVKEQLSVQTNKVIELESQIKSQKLEIEIQLREKLEKEYRDEIDKLKAEKAVMANEKRSSNQKQYGNDFEDRVQAELQSAFRRELIKKIPSGEEGADFIATVEKDGRNIGNILLECKNPQSNKIEKKWYDKLIKDGAKHDSRYKILVTQASENAADDILPYWLQDPVNNVYVVRLEFVKLFVELFSHIMSKEHAIEGLKDAEEAMEKYTKLLNFKDAEIRKIQKKMLERAEEIEKKCSTIENAVDSIRSAARLMIEKDIEEIIKGIEKI